MQLVIYETVGFGGGAGLFLFCFKELILVLKVVQICKRLLLLSSCTVSWPPTSRSPALSLSTSACYSVPCPQR